MSASPLAGWNEKSSYGGVPFSIRNPANKRLPRFGSIGRVEQRVAPYSYPANVTVTNINTGLLDTISVEIAIRGSNLGGLRAKLNAGMQALKFATDASQTAMLTEIKEVGALPSHGLIYCKCTWIGRP